MKNKTFLLGLIVVGIFSSLVFAEVQKPSAGMSGIPAGADQEQMKKQQEQMKQQQEQMKQQQEQMMEQMKKNDPKMYEQMKAQQDMQDKITKITTDFFANKISYEAAKSQLRPLVKQRMKNRIDNIDAEIAQEQKRIEELKDIKNNPDKAVDRDTDMMLGKGQPDMSGMVR